MCYVVEVVKRGGLTDRQREVLVQMANGLSAKQIGRALAISEQTVAKHCGAIYERMEVDRKRGDKRVFAVCRAISEGVIALKSM